MSVAASADALALEQCPSCGYRLDGLPPEGVCPECGRPYDQSVIVLLGWGRGSRADIVTARPWVAVLIGVVYVLAIVHYFRGALHGPPSAYLCPAIGTLMLGLAVWKRLTNDMPTPSQVRLSSAGCCQVDDSAAAEGVKLTPWSAVNRVVVESLGGERARIRFVCKTPWWKPMNIPVDAEVVAGPAKAEAIRRRIEGWRNRAATGPETAAPCPPAAGVG